jgi:hypothetical protein
VRLEEAQPATVPAPTSEGARVRYSWQKHILTFLMVFGPGLIVMEADNDAGAFSTYMQAGGQYGLHLLWLLVVLLPICYFVQEMVARLGIATGKGHAAMIYERFGKWWGRFSLFDLLVVNFLALITEFAAISMALRAMGVSPYLSVPTAALALTLMVVSGSYLRSSCFACSTLTGLFSLTLCIPTGPGWLETRCYPACRSAGRPAAWSSWSLQSSEQPSLRGSSSFSRAALQRSGYGSQISIGRASTR